MNKLVAHKQQTNGFDNSIIRGFVTEIQSNYIIWSY